MMRRPAPNGANAQVPWSAANDEPALDPGHATFPGICSLLIVIVLVGSGCASLERRPPGSAGTVESLFNGTNLQGWYSWLVDTKREDPRGIFTVTNGMIRISGDGLGYLATEREFNDYELTVEFQWGERNRGWGGRVGKARDSGLFLHSTGPDGNSHDGQGAFRAAIECQIMQGATGDFLLIRGTNADGSLLAPRVTVSVAPGRDADGWPTFAPGGARLTLERWGRVNWAEKSAHWQDEFDFRGSRDVEKAAGQWNHLQVTCEADRIEVRLNGIKVNEAREVFPRQGHILLQCEGSEIFFRNIEWRPLRKR